MSKDHPNHKWWTLFAMCFALFIAAGPALSIPLAVITSWPSAGRLLMRAGIGALPEENAVGKIGQGIVVRHVGDARLCQLSLRDVDDGLRGHALHAGAGRTIRSRAGVGAV